MKLPSQMRVEHVWRTRKDPFVEHWPLIEEVLGDPPDPEAERRFEWLCQQYPGVYEEGQLRTLQRKLRRWRGVGRQTRGRCQTAPPSPLRVRPCSSATVRVDSCSSLTVRDSPSSPPPALYLLTRRLKSKHVRSM